MAKKKKKVVYGSPDLTCPLCGKQKWEEWMDEEADDFCRCMYCFACGRLFPEDDDSGDLTVAPTDELAEAFGDFPRCRACWIKLEKARPK